MKYFKQVNIYGVSVTFAAILPLVMCYPQTAQKDDKEIEYRPGRYVPELHGASLGKWMPDYRGLYQHMKVPYDGGYGDSGVKYEHDPHDDVVRGLARAFQQKNPTIPFSLGPQDHLRFMIDFNFNGTGWQIIKFEWIRDGEDERHYNFVNENKLWETQDIQNTQLQQQSVEGIDIGYDYGRQEPEVAAELDVATGTDIAAEPDVSTEPAIYNEEAEVGGTRNVHVNGEYDTNVYNVTYMEHIQQPALNDPNVQASIREVLDYIVRHIIPTLS